MAKGIICPKGHVRTWKKGRTPTRTGEKQRYVCFTCGRTFYAEAAGKAKTTKKARKGR